MREVKPITKAQAHWLRVVAEHLHDRAGLNPISKTMAIALARAGMLWFRRVRSKERRADGAKKYVVRVTDQGWAFLRGEEQTKAVLAKERQREAERDEQRRGVLP